MPAAPFPFGDQMLPGVSQGGRWTSGVRAARVVNSIAERDAEIAAFNINASLAGNLALK
jgi:hypothetical protein